MDRKGFIGSTDTIKIAEGNWHELWGVKTGRIEPEDLSEVLPVQLGKWTEPFNLNWFEQNMNRIVTGQQSFFKQTIDGVPCQTNTDGHVYDGMVECKHTNAFTNMDEQLAKYMPQMQFAMHLAKEKRCYLSVIFGNSKWECVAVNYDEQYFHELMQHVKAFWKFVVTDNEPIALEWEPNTNSIPIDDMIIRDASQDNEFVSLANDFIDTKETASKFEDTKKQLKSLVANNEREVFCDILTIKRDKRGALRFTS
jgi:hypothetical protein